MVRESQCMSQCESCKHNTGWRAGTSNYEHVAVMFVGREGFGGMGGVGYLCSHLSQSQTCCGQGSSMHLP
ncbi:hypothetical protein TNCV_1451561 [Trichonephila clavipes]|nr:hypothetical protein TNCV_1451561 [Trichonephila clavipes]